MIIRDGTIPWWPIPISILFFISSYNFIYCIMVSEKCIHHWTHGMQYNDMLFNTCMRLKQPFYIIQHSDIISKLVVCSVWISLQLIIIIGCKVSEKYRNSIEKYSVLVSDFFCDTDTFQLPRYPILPVLDIGFLPSLVIIIIRTQKLCWRSHTS